MASAIPIRSVVLTAAGATLKEIMAAVWADIPNGTWTQVTQTQTTSPGDTSFAIESPDTNLQLNMLWVSTTSARIGVNPDGLGDTITNSASPHTGVANFSGTDGGLLVNIITPASAEFILLEWPDAIMIITKDATKATSLGAFHWGKIWLQPLSELESTAGGTRLDGHAMAPGKPERLLTASTGEESWVTNTGLSDFRRRCTLGQTLGSHTTSAWTDDGFTVRSLGVSDNAYTYLNTSAVTVGGGRVAQPIITYPSASPDAYVWKYVRMVGALLPPFQIYRIGTTEIYMTLNYDSVASCNLAVPIPDGFDPHP